MSDRRRKMKHPRNTNEKHRPCTSHLFGLSPKTSHQIEIFVYLVGDFFKMFLRHTLTHSWLDRSEENSLEMQLPIFLCLCGYGRHSFRCVIHSSIDVRRWLDVSGFMSTLQINPTFHDWFVSESNVLTSCYFLKMRWMPIGGSATNWFSFIKRHFQGKVQVKTWTRKRMPCATEMVT